MLAGRADSATLPWNTGGEDGTDARGLESKAGCRGNPGTQAQGWWGSPQHWPCHVAQDVGPDDYSSFPQLLFPILLQLLLKSFLQENLTPRGGVSANTKRGKKSVPGRAGRFHPRVKARRALRARAAAAPALPRRCPRRPHSERREKFYSGGSQTPRPTPAALTPWSRLKREREGAEEGGRRRAQVCACD